MRDRCDAQEGKGSQKDSPAADYRATGSRLQYHADFIFANQMMIIAEENGLSDEQHDLRKNRTCTDSNVPEQRREQ